MIEKNIIVEHINLYRIFGLYVNLCVLGKSPNIQPIYYINGNKKFISLINILLI